ncbi:MAG: AbrB/MazE/SpoVT family DNA-binding domain-containing protein [Candidatus Aenigmarchaeota archaeon]|nr:AbrB/MazE/SpoVT family DNA-binding domain-containing protein [Candidatus Aenigmarchaeota archaeon]
MKKEVMESISRLGPKGQIVLKKEFRKATGIMPGTVVKERLEGNRIVIEKLDVERELAKVEKIASMVSKKWPKGLSAVQAIREERR